MKIKLSSLVDEEDFCTYSFIHNVIKVSHRKEMIPYVWLQLDDDNIVQGRYCSSSMYENRTFDKVKIGDRIIIDTGKKI